MSFYAYFTFALDSNSAVQQHVYLTAVPITLYRQ